MPARSSWGTARRKSLGDYCAGPNHVLPTGRTARFSSPLGVYDFQKRSSVLAVSNAAARARSARWPPRWRKAKGSPRMRKARSTALRRTGPNDANVLPNLAAAVIRPEIRALTAYAVARADGKIKLDAMEVPYRLPAEVAAKVAAAVAAVPVNRYPDGSGEIVQRALRDTFGIPESLGLLLGNGSDELLQILTVAVARPGVTVMAPEPSFVMYRMNALYAGARFVGVPLAPDFALDTAAMLAAIEKERPALVFLAYPNNPTGNLFAAERYRGRPARRAGSRGRGRGVPRVRRRELPAAPCASSRTSSWCGPSRRSEWRACAWATRSRPRRGRRN